MDSNLHRRIDVHSHLLPGVDDGCADNAEAIECARRMVAAGYSHICCTPHLIPEMQNWASGNAAKVARLQSAMDAAGVPVTLIPGGEINIGRMWPAIREVDPLEIPTYGNARRFVLLDFWAEALPVGFEDAIRYLQGLNLTVILAHPERVGAFHEDDRLWREVQRMGIRLQGNLQCFSDPPGTPTRDLVEKHARDGTYWLFGSDCHVPETLAIRLGGLTIATKLLGEVTVDRLTRLNPSEVVGPARSIGPAGTLPSRGPAATDVKPG